MFKLTPENTSRKVDDLGRIVIPSSLRKRLSIRPNDELQFLMLECDNQNYICLTNNKTVDPRYVVAADVLNELGVELPTELIEAIQ